MTMPNLTVVAEMAEHFDRVNAFHRADVLCRTLGIPIDITIAELRRRLAIAERVIDTPDEQGDHGYLMNYLLNGDPE